VPSCIECQWVLTRCLIGSGLRVLNAVNNFAAVPRKSRINDELAIVSGSTAMFTRADQGTDVSTQRLN